MNNNDLERLKKRMDLLEIKVRFEKSGNNIIFNIIEYKSYLIISLKGIFWKKHNWKEYKILGVRKKITYNSIKDIKHIKNSLICEIIDKAIKIFF